VIVPCFGNLYLGCNQQLGRNWGGKGQLSPRDKVVCLDLGNHPKKQKMCKISLFKEAIRLWT
jgi:hypothetical protein